MKRSFAALLLFLGTIAFIAGCGKPQQATPPSDITVHFAEFRIAPNNGASLPIGCADTLDFQYSIVASHSDPGGGNYTVLQEVSMIGRKSGTELIFPAVDVSIPARTSDLSRKLEIANSQWGCGDASINILSSAHPPDYMYHDGGEATTSLLIHHWMSW